MERLVYIDLSRAYLLARHSFEARKVLDDLWLSPDRRIKATCLYVDVGHDFNDFFQELRELPVNMWYQASVMALEIFRDNLNEIWHYAYSGILREIVWLRR
jgi:hypothetical protein